MLFKSRASFTGGTSEGKNCKFLAVNHELIGRDLGGKKAVAHRFTILRPLSAGFASAPYKLKSPARNPEAKPLSELKFSDGHPVMTMWSFKKQGLPGNKGPRSELSWTLQAGNTVKMWVDEERLKDADLLAGDVPAFTVCEISVACKNEESVQGGWCIKIMSVRPADFSLHSMIGDLRSLCSNLGEARTREMMAKSNQPLLEKELETQSVALWSPVSREAVLDESGGTLKLAQWGDQYPVELQTEALMSATNCKRTDWACALLEVAIAAGAVSILVIANDFWKGGPRAVPIICAETLFEGVSGPGVHKTSFKADLDGEQATIEIEIGHDQVAVAGDKEPACDDFELAGLDTELAAAYPVQFNIVGENNRVPAVWKGYYNAGPSKSQPMLMKRKRMQTMDE